MAPGLAQIDWQAPWLAPVAVLGRQVVAQCQAGMLLPEALNACAPPADDLPVRFVPQSALPAGEAYESYIFNSKQCPTREGLHDFFNGLMWLRFPRTKARLNQLHAAQLTAGGIGRDAQELLRKVKAAQYVASHPGEVCPAKWKEGEATLAPSLDLVGKI